MESSTNKTELNSLSVPNKYKLTSNNIITVIMIIVIMLVVIQIFGVFGHHNNESVFDIHSANERIVNGRISTYIRYRDIPIDYINLESVKNKLAYSILSNVKYGTETNKSISVYSNIEDLSEYENKILNNSDIALKLTTDDVLNKLTRALKWLDTSVDGNGSILEPDVRINTAAVYLASNVNYQEKIVFTHLYKSGHLLPHIQNKMSDLDYNMLVQSSLGVAGLIQSCLLI